LCLRFQFKEEKNFSNKICLAFLKTAALSAFITTLEMCSLSQLHHLLTRGLNKLFFTFVKTNIDSGQSWRVQ